MAHRLLSIHRVQRAWRSGWVRHPALRQRRRHRQDGQNDNDVRERISHDGSPASVHSRATALKPKARSHWSKSLLRGRATSPPWPSLSADRVRLRLIHGAPRAFQAGCRNLRIARGDAVAFEKRRPPNFSKTVPALPVGFVGVPLLIDVGGNLRQPGSIVTSPAALISTHSTAGGREPCGNRPAAAARRCGLAGNAPLLPRDRNRRCCRSRHPADAVPYPRAGRS
jgi:hypothetical protein